MLAQLLSDDSCCLLSDTDNKNKPQLMKKAYKNENSSNCGINAHWPSRLRLTRDTKRCIDSVIG